jgi:hypothetical protein
LERSLPFTAGFPIVVYYLRNVDTRHADRVSSSHCAFTLGQVPGAQHGRFHVSSIRNPAHDFLLALILCMYRTGSLANGPNFLIVLTAGVVHRANLRASRLLVLQ